ncbi:interleukin-3 receptor subunit alpha [Bos taurus]|uniref:interleukin-3 receptor subunit alpha n=1 Tax=Bos taurus TaxID=9913 RepID=UPI000D53BAFC|nr:interleukin-3 receptor subunit alpha [Bos taurus]
MTFNLDGWRVGGLQSRTLYRGAHFPHPSLFFANPKEPLAAADNLTCRVHDVDQLSCSWAVGEEAPANVQYHFYLKHPLKTWPCPKYMQNQQGVNVQCHFDSLSLQPERQTLFRFLVNGTSGGSKIPCRQMTHRLEEIEILAAPNITKKWCNESYSFMEWEVRSLFTEDIKYELEIQKGTDLAYKEEVGVHPVRPPQSAVPSTGSLFPSVSRPSETKLPSAQTGRYHLHTPPSRLHPSGLGDSILTPN